MGYNLRNIVFCPLCFYDIEEDFGYLEWKNWNYCPECGSKLVNVPIENRPEEYEIYKKLGFDVKNKEYRKKMYEATKNSNWLE